MPDGQDTIQGTSIHFSRVTRWENDYFAISFTHLNFKYHFNNALWYQTKHISIATIVTFLQSLTFTFTFSFDSHVTHTLKRSIFLINFAGTIRPLLHNLSNFMNSHYSDQYNHLSICLIYNQVLFLICLILSIGTTRATTSVRRTMVSETALLPRKSGSKFIVSFSRKNYFPSLF